jgi:hypothetical protein
MNSVGNRRKEMEMTRMPVQMTPETSPQTAPPAMLTVPSKWRLLGTALSTAARRMAMTTAKGRASEAPQMAPAKAPFPGILARSM